MSTLIHASMFLLVPATAVHIAYGMAADVFPTGPHVRTPGRDRDTAVL